MRRVIQEKTEGQLAQTFREAMRAWDAMKADGVPFLERVKALEAILRQAWPFTREWKFLCQSCLDLGLVMHDCAGDATCGRPKAHGPHTFGEPCWCALGARFRVRPKGGPDDFEAAGKVRQPARVGR